MPGKWKGEFHPGKIDSVGIGYCLYFNKCFYYDHPIVCILFWCNQHSWRADQLTDTLDYQLYILWHYDRLRDRCYISCCRTVSCLAYLLADTVCYGCFWLTWRFADFSSLYREYIYSVMDYLLLCAISCILYLQKEVSFYTFGMYISRIVYRYCRVLD